MACLVLGLFGGYIITSYFFFKYPHLLHKVKKRSFRACHISHRGGAGERLENTMEAFKHAISLGTDMLELDCHITKDGHVVVSHDDHLHRAAGISKTVSELCLDQLPQLSQEIEVSFDPGNVFQGDQADRTFARLEDVFSEFKNVPINVDVKVDNDELIQKVSDLIVQYKRESITVWGNSSAKVTEKCYLQNPSIPVIFSFRRVILVLVCYVTGFLPFLPLKETFFEVPMLSVLLDPAFTKGETVSLKKRMAVSILERLVLSPSLVGHLKKRGIATFIWVCNTESQYDRAYRSGVEGVMTDYPTLLASYLAKNPSIRQTAMSMDQ